MPWERETKALIGTLANAVTQLRFFPQEMYMDKEEYAELMPSSNSLTPEEMKTPISLIPGNHAYSR